MNKNIPENIDIHNLIKKYSTPLQIYDETSIRNNVRELLSKFNLKFKFKQFFTIKKALPNPHILKILIEGCGLGCGTQSELKNSKMLNVDSKNIVFTSNYTSGDDLKLAQDMNVIINLDDYKTCENFMIFIKNFKNYIFPFKSRIR